jgi:hypothetical protein
MRVIRMTTGAALAGVIASILAAGVAAGAPAARFTVTFAGHDTLVWSVAAGRECTRSGPGHQGVEFADAHPVTTQIGRLRAPARSRRPVLVFGSGHEGGLDVPGKATVTRVDETTLSPGRCNPMPAKDCAGKPLPRFFPTIWGSDSGGFALHGPYWKDEPEAPFGNCLSMQTPENLAHNEVPYTGWQFGDQLPWREHGDIVTRPLSPGRLHLGRTYKFAAHRVIQLTDADLHGYVIFSNGLGGTMGGEVLGGETVITDNISWEITLKRVA